MIVSLQFSILFLTINFVETTTFSTISNIPTSDLLINIDKAFVLKRLGTYSSKLQEEIVHTFVPLDDLCTTSPDANVCVFTNHISDSNVLELSTILSSRTTVTALPRYNYKEVVDLIGKDFMRVHQTYRFNTFTSKPKSAIHLLNDQFHMIDDIKKPPHDLSQFLVNNIQSDIPRVSRTTSAIILRQIAHNRVGFDFLTNPELMSLLITVMSSIDRSFKITNIYESLDHFSQLIIAQSIYILRSCSYYTHDGSTSPPCFAISSLYLRPLVESNTALSVYQLISLPVIVNAEKYIYSNMPEVIVINTDNQMIMLWDSVPKAHECIFSIFVYCHQKPPLIHLVNTPCLFELFSDNTRIVSSCQVTRVRAIQTNIIALDTDVYLFSHNEQPIYCQISSNTDELGGIMSIIEPSIIRVPCGNAIKCTNVELPSSPCVDRSILIQSTNGKQEFLSFVPISVKNMRQYLTANYKLSIRNLLKETLDDLKDDRITITNVIKEFGAAVSSTLFLLIISWILLFIRWLKRIVQQRIEKLERKVDDLEYVHTIKL